MIPIVVTIFIRENLLFLLSLPPSLSLSLSFEKASNTQTELRFEIQFATRNLEK